jgi:hypothetical protein
LKRAFVHIGLEKTGTTALQIFLKSNEAVLRSRGFSYLCEDDKPYFERDAHFPLAGCNFAERPDFVSPAKFRPAEEVLESLRRDVVKSPYDVVISCEHLSSRVSDPEVASAILDALPDRDIRIVCYLRRQDEMALAAYSTSVRCGRREPFSIEEAHPGNRYFNYRAILEVWGSVGGVENITVREFDRRKLVGGDICQDFMALIGVLGAGFALGLDENPSLDSLRLEMLRQINCHLPAFSAGVERAAFDDAQEVRSLLEPLLPIGSAIGGLLGVAKRRKIMARFEDTNRWIAETLPNAGFVLGWQEPRGRTSDGLEPNPVSLADYARAVVSCGREILRLRRMLAGQEDALADTESQQSFEAVHLAVRPLWRLLRRLRRRPGLD